MTNKSEQTRAELKALILEETRFFMERNFEKWAECWIHDEESSILECRPAFAEEIRGWDEISVYMKGLLSEGTTELDDSVTKTDFVYQIGSDMAFVSFKEDGNSSTRLMRKTEEGWKICHVGVVYTSLYKKQGRYIHNWETRKAKLEETGIINNAR